MKFSIVADRPFSGKAHFIGYAHNCSRSSPIHDKNLSYPTLYKVGKAFSTLEERNLEEISMPSSVPTQETLKLRKELTLNTEVI